MRITVLLCLLTTFAWGCAHGPDPARDLVRVGDNPNNYLVGGGIVIEYRAPTAGTAVLLDRTSRRLLLTRSLEPGQVLEASVYEDPAEAEELLGLPLHEADLRLYFFPAAADATAALTVDDQ